MDNWASSKTKPRYGAVFACCACVHLSCLLCQPSLRVEAFQPHSHSTSSFTFKTTLKRVELSPQYFACRCFLYYLFHLPKKNKKPMFPLSCNARPLCFYHLPSSLMYYSLPLAASRLLSENGIFFKQKSSFTH